MGKASTMTKKQDLIAWLAGFGIFAIYLAILMIVCFNTCSDAFSDLCFAFSCGGGVGVISFAIAMFIYFS